jgi:hypothetical protein
MIKGVSPVGDFLRHLMFLLGPVWTRLEELNFIPKDLLTVWTRGAV